MLSYPDFIELCNQAEIKIADASMNIGRELSYRSAPDRIIVIHFIQSDFPETWKKTLYGILQLVCKRLAVPPTKNIPPAASCDFLIRSRYGHHIEMATAY